MKQIEEQINILKQKFSKDEINNIDLESITNQLKLFISGVKIPHLVKPCKLDDGIVKLYPEEFDELFNLHSIAAENSRLMKFVPASGAASRMFQKLQSILNRFQNLKLEELKNKSTEDKECKSVYDFLINLKKFAFFNELKSLLNVDEDGFDKLLENDPETIIKAVLFEPGLNYSVKPKGAIKFHRYDNTNRTAFEEQVYESIKYICDKQNKLKLHFTISEEHQNLFLLIIEKVKEHFKNNYSFNISFSFQKKSTDTIAVDESNNILFGKSGKLILRPAGHGALIENMNDLNADLVVIKNIDNLSVEKLSDDTINYKKLLIGYLVKIQNKVFSYLNLLEKDLAEKFLDEVSEFAEKFLFISKPFGFADWKTSEKQKYYFNKLNRPIRVCGMVKNEGEPGGGPFWVKEIKSDLSVQIIEQAQINLNDEQQKNIFMQSTHFNPVDLICGLKDYRGNKFDLHKFVDHQSGIITKKSKDGIELKALELPGLWNGSMADWITIFVEVPISTFNPVKEINDLLRKEHQN